MRRVVKKNGRDKAFIGAIIGAAAGIAGSAISANKKRKAEELAFDQAQKEQSRIDGIAQAAAMTSSYANQGYIDQYQDKVVLKGGGAVKYKKGTSSDRIANKKKFLIGGRSKKLVGSELIDPSSVLTKVIGSVGQGVNNAMNAANGNANNLPAELSSGMIGTMDAINANKEVAQNEINKKTKTVGTTNVAMVKPNLTNIRPTAAFGADLGNAAAAAIPGVGGLVGALLNKPKAPKMIKKADGFAFNAPKTGLVANSYEVDINGNPITAVPNIAPQLDDNSVLNRTGMPVAKMGKLTKRSMKSGL